MEEVGGASGSEWQTEAEEESSLKSLVKIMKTNGDTVSRDGEENFICEASTAAAVLGVGLGRLSSFGARARLVSADGGEEK